MKTALRKGSALAAWKRRTAVIAAIISIVERIIIPNLGGLVVPLEAPMASP
jgi:hypothetical protein